PAWMTSIDSTGPPVWPRMTSGDAGSPTSQAMIRYIRDFEENGGANYVHWEKVRQETRSLAGRLIQCTPEEIALTANTSEGANIVAQGLGFEAGDNVVIPEEDFPANVYPWLNLERKGVQIRFAPIQDGRWPIELLLNLVDERTRLVAVSSVAYFNGFRLDLEALGTALYEKGIPFYVDAIQSLGVFPMDVGKCHISFLSADGHKWLLGPEGAALFYCAKEWMPHLKPAYLSWLSVQEPFRFGQKTVELAESARRFESGTPNFTGIVGLNASLKILLETGIDRIGPRIMSLLDISVKGLKEKGYEILSPWGKSERSGIITFRHPEHEAASIQERLLEAGVVTTLRGGGVRISPHFYNTEDEIERFLGALP
ncbi:MAG: aminotransferase class V-fold PLP-dependent enzyme, partial [Planctomycetes bacterium]|nr:aminotransferase class V-fold PLP-dependent enzyme [Planctomycetota bacterium]